MAVPSRGEGEARDSPACYVIKAHLMLGSALNAGDLILGWHLSVLGILSLLAG